MEGDRAATGDVGVRIYWTATEGDPAATVGFPTVYGLLAQSGEPVAPVLDIDEQLIGIVGVRGSITGIAAAFGPLRRPVRWPSPCWEARLLGILLGYGLAGRLAGPIDRTVDAVERIGRVVNGTALPSSGPMEITA